MSAIAGVPFNATLRPYQQIAHTWLEEHPHSLLADAVGLGKTHTATSVLAKHLPALVIAPAYLTRQWFDMLCETLPHASISLPEGAHGRREHELQAYADVRIVNTEMLRTYTMPEVRTVVVDEAHHLRNPKAAQSRNARSFLWNTDRVHMLTATPYYKGDEDIWHLLHILAPKLFPSYWSFIREWYTVNWNAAYAPIIYGISKRKRAEYEQVIAPYVLMRDYEDVGRQLPPLIEKYVTFELPALIHREYTKLKKGWQLLGEPVDSVGAVYYILRRLTMCAPKLDAVQGIVDSVPDDTVLVYTWYKESATALATKLHSVQPLLLTGDTPPDARAAALKEQKRTGKPRVIVATIGAVQEGVNLEHIRHVVYAEETYVIGEHLQTLARARRDRAGDTRPVICYYVRAKHTIDEAIPRLRNSRGMANNRELARALAAQPD